MARYRLKRKTYGIIGDTAGEVVKGVGRAVKTAGTGLLGTVVGATIGKSVIQRVGNAIGKTAGTGLLGTVVGATIGKSVIQGVGNAIGKTGESMQNN